MAGNQISTTVFPDTLSEMNLNPQCLSTLLNGHSDNGWRCSQRHCNRLCQNTSPYNNAFSRFNASLWFQTTVCFVCIMVSWLKHTKQEDIYPENMLINFSCNLSSDCLTWTFKSIVRRLWDICFQQNMLEISKLTGKVMKHTLNIKALKNLDSVTPALWFSWLCLLVL